MEAIVTLDVRPILARGEEPVAVILAAADALSPGQTLRLLAPFRPVPLFRVMAKRGFDHHDLQLSGSDWQIDFAPQPRCWVRAARLMPLTGPSRRRCWI